MTLHHSYCLAKKRPFARGFATRGKRVRRASVAWQKRFATSVTAAKEVGY